MNDDAARPAHAGFPTTLAAAVLTVAVLAGGCFSSRSGDDGTSSRFEDAPVRVHVENQNWSAVHVYVVAGGQFQSLGQLSSQNEASYDVPVGMLGSRQEIRLMADAIGSRESHLTDAILIQPGDLVEWTISQPLVHSSVMVR